MSAAATVEARLRRLDAGAAAALVADLWAARGFETARDGHLVVATAGDGSVVIRTVGSGVRAPPSVDRPVDVVVAPDGGRAASSAADDHGARLLDAADLAEMLLYAVDRETAADLCRRHLGDPPGDLAPPRRTILRRRVRSLRSWPTRARVSVVVAALLVVVASAGVAGLALAPDPGPTGQSATTPAGAGAPAAGSSATPARGDAASVPGLASDGIANLTALSAAHGRALAGRSYTVWLDLYRPRGGDPNATRVQRDVDVAVADGRYLAEATVDDGSVRTPVLTLYYDGDDRYVADPTADAARYRRLAADERSPVAVPDLFVSRRAVITRFLSTPETDVAGRVREDGRTLYRVTGSGRPAGSVFDAARNYTVVALVDERGFVRELAAEYAVDTGAGSYPVRFEATYDRLGRTTVTAPPWYERRFAGNGTATPPG